MKYEIMAAEIGGSVNINEASLQLKTEIINKVEVLKATILFKMKINCQINGSDIETIFLERLFDLSQNDFNNLLGNFVIKMKDE